MNKGKELMMRGKFFVFSIVLTLFMYGMGRVIIPVAADAVSEAASVGEADGTDDMGSMHCQS